MGKVVNDLTEQAYNNGWIDSETAIIKLLEEHSKSCELNCCECDTCDHYSAAIALILGD